jgi:hypothetical protein
LDAIVIGNGAAGVSIVSVCVQAARTLDEYLTMCLVLCAGVGRRFPRASNYPVVEAFSRVRHHPTLGGVVCELPEAIERSTLCDEQAGLSSLRSALS